MSLMDRLQPASNQPKSILEQMLHDLNAAGILQAQIEQALANNDLNAQQQHDLRKTTVDFLIRDLLKHRSPLFQRDPLRYVQQDFLKELDSPTTGFTREGLDAWKPVFLTVIHDAGLALSSEDIDALWAKTVSEIIEAQQLSVNEPTQSQNTRQINQGDVFWHYVDDPRSTETPIRHPHVVVQDNVFNHSRVSTVIVCALTSNLQRASLPGNVLLDDGEANLSRRSVVEVAKISSVEKSQLGEYIGTLSPARVQHILDGLRFLQTSYFRR